ncbi:MAG TPA: response regulator transcription factor [Candidatus Elarobacter sp.]|nr:response regulator transcription factor [Candidatus Elarobacter sp.]
MAAKVLLVDDDDALRQTVARTLELEGYRVVTACDGNEALASFAEGAILPDVVVLDVLMPNLDGIAACRLIRGQCDVPILMLTARHEIENRIAGLDAGADDYLGKPFAVSELLARLRALLRRGHTSVLRYADLELNSDEHSVSRGSRRISLTRIEFALLELFLLNPRRALDRQTIYTAIWGYDIDHASNSLDVFVGSLRRKTEASGEPRLIQTVRGIGYALRTEA